MAIDVNALPIASAGDDQSVVADVIVTLDDTGSSDDGGRIFAFVGTQTEGKTVTLTNPKTATTTFYASDADDAGETITLHVANSKSVDTAGTYK